MPEGGASIDDTFSLVVEEDGRLDGLMYVFKPTEDHSAMVLLRIRELNDGSWSVTRSSPRTTV